MRKLLPFLLLLATASTAHAQISVPFSFTSGTVANPTEVNTNFAKFADALNRTGGTMTGTLTSQQITPSATNTYDWGSAAALFRTGYLRTSMVLGQATANYTLTWANPASARAISFEDPGGTDILVYKAATQTLTNKTLTSPTISAPTLSGTATGTYTLGGTPSFAAAGFTLAGATVAQADALSGRLLFGDGTATNTALRIISGSTTILSLDAVLSNSSATEKTLAFQSNAGATTFGGSVSVAGALASTVASTNTHIGSLNGSLGWAITNSNAGTSAVALTQYANDSSDNGYTMLTSSGYTGIGGATRTMMFRGSATGGTVVSAETAAGAIKFVTGGASVSTNLRWGIDSSGNTTFGASSHIALGAATPSISSGFGTSPSIAGNSYAFNVTTGTGVATGGTVSFGVTYNTAPVVNCLDNDVSTFNITKISVISTTSVTLNASAAWTAGTVIRCSVHGF